MSNASIVIDADEWDTLACLASRLQPNETGLTPGVALRHERGQRRWSIFTPWVELDVAGGDGHVAVPGTTWLPTRLVIHAAELAAVDGTCTLVLANQSATIVNSAGNAHFGLPDISLPARRGVIRCADSTAAVADLTCGQFLALLRSTRRVPAGVDLSSTTSPDLWLGIEDGHLAATVAWSHFGAPRVTIRTPATTTGETVVRVPHLDLALLLDSFHDDAQLRVSVDDTEHVLGLDGTNWSAAVALTQMPAVPTTDTTVTTVDEALEGLATRTHHGAPWTIEIADCSVSVTDVAGADTVRATVDLARDIEPATDVLVELNSLNAGLDSIRVWLADGTIRAGIDHPRRHLAELPDALRALVAATADIGMLVGMLGGSTTQSTGDDTDGER